MVITELIVQGLEIQLMQFFLLVNFDITVEVVPISDLFHLRRISDICELCCSALKRILLVDA